MLNFILGVTNQYETVISSFGKVDSKNKKQKKLKIVTVNSK